MQVQLYHNPKSGGSDCKSQQLADRIEAAGHRVILKALADPPGDEECDVVAIAGGDGTVEKVVRQHYRALIARRVPISILPMGTANNIARSLGISRQPNWLLNGGAPDGRRPEKKLSLGIAAESAREYYFVESIGCGVLAELIRNKDRRDPNDNISAKSSHRHVAAVQSLVQDLEASDCQVTIDGRDYSNRYLLMEVMNTSYVGPGLMLAPEADPGDEYFQVVLIASAEKNLLANYLADILQGANPENPFFRVTGKRVEFSCAGASLHVDDAYLHNGGHGKFTILANADPLPVMD